MSKRLRIFAVILFTMHGGGQPSAVLYSIHFFSIPLCRLLGTGVATFPDVLL